MPQVAITNFASGLLANAIVAADTTVTLQTGQGVNFPSPVAPVITVCAIEDSSGNKEIVHMTSRTSDVCTVIRARESTTAQDFPAGSRFEVRQTADTILNQDSGEY